MQSIATCIRSPIAAVLAISIALAIALFGQRTLGRALLAAGAAWLVMHLTRVRAHSHFSDWLVGKEPRKNELQMVGEALQSVLARVQVPSVLNELKITVREAQDDSRMLELEFCNSSRFSMRKLSINVLNSMEFLAPGVASMEQWNHDAKGWERLRAIFQPIDIANLDPGQSVILRRQLLPGVVPVPRLTNVKLLHELSADSVAKHYYVQVAVSPGIKSPPNHET